MMASAEALDVPTPGHGLSQRPSASPNRHSKMPWKARNPFGSSSAGSKNGRHDQDETQLSREPTCESARSRFSSSAKKGPWWKTRLFAGMINDVRRRAPFFWSDWKDAWDYRVVPATVYMYFAKYVSFNVCLLSLLGLLLLFHGFSSCKTPSCRS